jgi:hypothetical protein
MQLQLSLSGGNRFSHRQQRRDADTAGKQQVAPGLRQGKWLRGCEMESRSPALSCWCK